MLFPLRVFSYFLLENILYSFPFKFCPFFSISSSIIYSFAITLYIYTIVKMTIKFHSNENLLRTYNSFTQLPKYIIRFFILDFPIFNVVMKFQLCMPLE